MKKMWYIYIQWSIIQSQRKMKLCCFQENGWNYIMLSEITQTKKDKYKCQGGYFRVGGEAPVGGERRQGRVVRG
jgi:hypothetical protein